MLTRHFNLIIYSKIDSTDHILTVWNERLTLPSPMSNPKSTVFFKHELYTNDPDRKKSDIYMSHTITALHPIFTFSIILTLWQDIQCTGTSLGYENRPPLKAIMEKAFLIFESEYGVNLRQSILSKLASDLFFSIYDMYHFCNLENIVMHIILAIYYLSIESMWHNFLPTCSLLPFYAQFSRV